MKEVLRKPVRILAGVLTGMALALLVLSCSNKGGAASSTAGKTVVRWLVPGAALTDQDRVMAAVNKKLEADGLNIELNLERIDWEVWEQKTNLMISTREEFDLIHVMQGSINFDVYASRGATAAIDDAMLAQYGPDLLKMIRKEEWDAARYNGRIHTIPDVWYDMGAGGVAYAMRRDLFDKYNVPVPTNWENFITNSVTLQNAIYRDIGERYYWLVYADRPSPPAYFAQNDPGWPYSMETSNGGTSFIKVNKDGSIESLLESSLVREGSIYQRRVFQAGLIMPDLLSIPRDTYMTQYIEAGKGLYSYAGYWERLENSVPGANVTALDFAQSTESVISTYFLNSNAISTTSKHPEAAIQLMNWIETRENGQLLCYGILGEDWKKSSKGDQYYIPARDDGGYFFDMWEFLPYQFRMYLESTPEWMLNVAPPEKVYYAQNAGFIFDAQPVLNEWTNLDAKYNELVWPLFMGMIDYDSNITRIMREFRSLGLDKYMAEYERQFRLWQAGQGK